MLRKTLVVILVAGMVFPSASTLAGPTVPGLRGGVPAAVPLPADTLPIPTDVNLRGVSSFTVDGAARKLTVHQDEPRAVINWKSFDIGEQAWTHFDQKGNKNWAALNRIHDLNPSRIMGKLTADGKVYLINQNGILFGRNSQVNVQALTAATLNAVDDDFLAGLNRFKAEDYMGAGADAVRNPSVVNEGSITVNQLGSVFLLGQSVTNSGSIDAPVGQIGLAAGSEVELLSDSTFTRAAQMVKVSGETGRAVNTATGSLTSDTGLVGMYGREVQQDGLIRSETAIKKSGQVELFATDLIATGPGSLTATPVSDSDETAHESFVFQGGRIRMTGLDSNSPGFPHVDVKRIEHRGALSAPSGEISLEAIERVYLEAGSFIDVGGVWVDKPASARIVEAQLNSVNLKDDYGQKEGLLKGKTVRLEIHTGTAIGDISGSLKSRELSAMDRSTSGGDIFITSTDGDVVMKPGASVSFTGGGTRYGSGALDTTALIAGRKFYDIAVAPQWLVYDGILNVQSVIHRRFGIKEDYKGLFTGGAVPLHKRVDALVQGADAGMLQIMARHVLLDGILDGSATRGFYQSKSSDPVDEFGYQTALGWREPRGGTLIIGDPPSAASPELIDFMTHAVRLSSAPPPLSRDMGPQDRPWEPADPRETILSAAILNGAGLGQLSIYANTTFESDADAAVSLPAGGSFVATARRIEHRGSVSSASGSIRLATLDNITSMATRFGAPNDRYVPLDSLIFLAGGSVLDASGQRVDCSLLGKALMDSHGFKHIQGGAITVSEGTSLGAGVFMMRGALADVSGGYGIDISGKVSKGNAGSLDWMGAALALDGTLDGYSILGAQGGKFTAHARNVRVSSSAPLLPDGFDADSEIPVELRDTFVLAQDRLRDAGFAQIEVKSANDLVFDAGVALMPSSSKYVEPMPVQAVPGMAQAWNSKGVSNEAGRELTQVASHLLGKTSFKASAGVVLPVSGGGQVPNDSARLLVSSGGSIEMAPGGEIGLQGPAVEVAGRLSASGGKLSARATIHDLVVREGSLLTVKGVGKPDAAPLTARTVLGYTPLSGGEISLESSGGSLLLEPGSTVDVSGCGPVPVTTRTSSGTVHVAALGSDAGKLSLIFLDQLVMDGAVSGQAGAPGMRGGAVTVGRRDTQNLLQVGDADLGRYNSNGFETLTLLSWGGIEFSGAVRQDFARSLTLDAPRILGSAETDVKLSSPWITLKNSFWPETAGPAAGQGSLTLSSEWLDVEGSLVLSGFKDVTLTASRDLRLSDRLYMREGSDPLWRGSFRTAADLTLMADRIYPTTLSSFRMESTRSITTGGSRGDLARPIYSAGGNLTLAAPLIHHQGFLAAPMGSLSLLGTGADSRVVLAQGSFLATTGNTAVNYGSLDNMFWTITDKVALLPKEIRGTPEKSIQLEAAEIIAAEGSRIDGSGGGEIFAYQFLPGIAGSVNPLSGTGRYVVLPGDPLPLPGDTVTLEGSELLPAGVYTLLPERYAFLPGAVVITELSGRMAPGDTRLTQEGYRVVSGYETNPGSTLEPAMKKGYALRPAEDVLREGDFTVTRLQAGEAGWLSARGTTTVFGGSFKASALEGFEAGSMTMSARNIVVQEEGVPLPADFRFDSAIPEELRGKLYVSASALSGGGIGRMVLGDAATETVTLTPGSSLEAAMVTLNASREILLQSGAGIRALSVGGSRGEAILNVPGGTLTLEEGSRVHASHGISLQMNAMSFLGDLVVDNSSLNLKGDRITFLQEGYGGDGGSGLFLTERLWKRFDAFENISLKSASDIRFLGDFDLGTAGVLTLDAPRIAGEDPLGDGTSDVRLRARRIELLNTSGRTSMQTALPDSGSLRLEANEMVLARGDVLLDGFGSAAFQARGDFTLKGKGSLTTGGDLDILAARIATSFYTDADTPFTAADYRIDALAGAFSLNRSEAAAGTGVIPGGTLSIRARSIQHGGVIDLRSGRVSLAATGVAETDSVTLAAGSQIIATGSDMGPGGAVSLSAVGGAVRVEAGSRIDVSAGSRWDAGSLSIVSPSAPATVQGTILGRAGSGSGGSFSLDTLALADFSALNAVLGTGGFDRSVDLRVRNGDVVVAATDLVSAHRFSLAADAGNIQVLGRIDASRDSGGGAIGLHAGGDLNLGAGSVLRAAGSGIGASGGRVSLSSASGFLRLLEGSAVDVSGGAGGRGGTAHLRAQRQGDDVRMDLDGSVSGVSEILAEAVGITAYAGNKTLGANDIATLRNDTELYMANAPAIEARLLAGLERNGWDDSVLRLVPGIELRSTGSMTLGTGWDLTTWRFADEPGVVTLRAGGHLNIRGDLVDHPTALGVPTDLTDPGLFSWTARSSWGFNLAAGADVFAADVLAVGNGAWDLAMDSGRQVYSESAALRFASARDTLLGTSATTVYMNYANMGGSLSSYTGMIQGRIGRDLKISGGAVQTATGDIDLSVGRDVILEFGAGTTGAIRTLGESPRGKVSNDPVDSRASGVSQYWTYAGGGDIFLSVGGAVNGVVNVGTDALRQGWDQAYGTRPPRKWAASYVGRDATQGIAAMGGGSVRIATGGNFRAQSGVFGEGDFSLFSGGTIRGRFMVKDGDGSFLSMGSFGGGTTGSVIEAFDAHIDVRAQGNVDMAAIVNPTIARSLFTGLEWELGYTEDTSVRLFSAAGSVSLYGDSPFYNLVPSAARLERVLPGTLEIEAAGDIRILNEMALAPSRHGNLQLIAGGNIDGAYRGSGGAPVRGLIAMSDMDPSEVYGYRRGFAVSELFSRYAHGKSLLHEGDTKSSLLRAGGSITDLQLYMAESVLLHADRDVRDVFLFGQNVRPRDLTGVLAGGSIVFSSALGATDDTGIEVAGPGTVHIQAIDSIDLGRSKGFRSVGNAYNPILGEKGSDLIVAAGFQNLLDRDWVPVFFDGAREAGKNYSLLMKEGDVEGAHKLLEHFREESIQPHLAPNSPSSPGRINMTTSQISTTATDSDIFVLAGGEINVGKSTFFTDEQERQGTGIYTAAGGAINVFSHRDINVNESRVMTFRGGDITFWSDRGNINAGRGSKTAVSATPPKLTKIGDIWVLVFNPPALGSGVRAVTFDPDGVEGPMVEPPAGDVYLFAPEGVIDAGEAGIAGTNVFLGATQVLNVENISFTAGSVGVPTASDASTSIGALSGASTVTEGVKEVQQSASMASGRNGGGMDQSATEGFMAKWLEVKVLSFDVEEPSDSEEES